MSAKLSAIEMLTWLIRRRDEALAQTATHTKQGNVGQRVYWHTIAVDAGLLLGMVSADDYWTALARQDAGGLKEEVEQLDARGHAENLVPIQAIVSYTP